MKNLGKSFAIIHAAPGAQNIVEKDREFGQALTSPAFSTIVGQDCHLLQEPLAHMLGTKETNKAKSKEAENK